MTIIREALNSRSCEVLVFNCPFQWIRNLAASETQAYAKAGAVVEQALSSIKTVMAFNGQEKESQRCVSDKIIFEGQLVFLNGPVIKFQSFRDGANVYWVLTRQIYGEVICLVQGCKLVPRWGSNQGPSRSGIRRSTTRPLHFP